MHKTRQQHVAVKHLNSPAVIVIRPPPTGEPLPGGSLAFPMKLLIAVIFWLEKKVNQCSLYTPLDECNIMVCYYGDLPVNRLK